MRMLSLGRRRPTRIAVVAIFGAILALATVLGGVARTAEASGMHGGLVIYPDGSLSAFVPNVLVSQQPAGTCAADGASGAYTCTFTAAPHAGDAIVQHGVIECFLMTPSGGAFTSFNSMLVYAPSGQVMARCSR